VSVCVYVRVLAYKHSMLFFWIDLYITCDSYNRKSTIISHPLDNKGAFIRV
jgi:hypothetical protein